jgi:hypothetical protein
MTEINALCEFPTSTTGRSGTQSNLSAVPPTEVLLLEQLVKSIAPSTAMHWGWGQPTPIATAVALESKDDVTSFARGIARVSL